MAFNYLLLVLQFDKLVSLHHFILATPHQLAYNLLQQMSLEDFHRLENNLHFLQTTNTALSKQNQEQSEEISHLSQRISELETQVNNQPIHLITQQLDPLSQSNSLVQLEDKISLLTFQNAHLEQLIRDRSILLTEVHTQLNELAEKLEESQQQNEELNHQLRSVNIREERARKETEVWKARLEKANQQRLKLISENSDLLHKLKQEQSKNYSSLSDAGKEIISFKEKAGKQAKEEPENKELQEILRIQLDEMQERNEEIARLKAINGNFGENSEVDHLKNTIKHLRGEISRYSNLVQHATEKLALAETTIQRYSASAQKCDQELASVGELNERIQEQAQTIRLLQLELNRSLEQVEKEKKVRNENKTTLIEILQENQCFHEFLFETYGDNFEELLKSVRNQYQERLRARAQHQKWATVDELIEVNERLRIRLKIS